jgi:hypothetical protein
MNKKVFFLLILPFAWLVVSMIATPFHPDKFYIVALAPSVWLALFGGFFSHTTFEMLVAGLPAMALVGLILILLKMTPRAAIISSLVPALVLWGSFLIVVWESRAIRACGAPFAWFLCCFDLALYLLPILALLGIVGRLLIKAFKRPKTDTRKTSHGEPIIHCRNDREIV